MLFDRQSLLAKIIHRLTIMQECLKWHSVRGENEACKTAEDVVARFLAKLCGWDLVNLNTIKPNYPAADLGDLKKKIAIQVTVNGTPKKVNETHEKAIAHKLSDDFERLIILFLLPEAPDDPGPKAKFTRCTSPEIEKWARPKLNELLDKADTDVLAEVLAVLEREMSAISAILDPARQPCPRNLPYPTLGTLFKGRAPFLASLKEQLTTAHTTVIRGMQAIHGMGGIGKTRAAVEYAWQHEAHYNALLFISADSPEALTRNLAALTGPLVLNLPEHTATDIRVQTAAVLAWLQQHPGWFLIIDNVDTPDAQNAVTDLLAQLPDGHIVITSRLADWAPEVTALDLDVLSEESSIEFLNERTAGRRIVRDDDLATAKTIAKNLDYLALALEQSAATIRARRCTYGDYLRDWETKRPHVMATHDPAKSHYPKSVAITFDTSIAQLTEEARQLFRILAWLAPEPMPMVHLEKLHIPTPKGLQHSAQGWSEERATTLGDPNNEFEPQRGSIPPETHHDNPAPDATPLGLDSVGDGDPRVARSSQPWAESCNPVGVQTSDGNEASAPTPPDPRTLLIQLADLHLANLSADGTTFAIHRLLQEVARQQQREQKPQALVTTLEWINDEMPQDTDDVRSWPIAIPLVPHAVATATFAADRDIATPTARLLNCAAILLRTQANYRAAEPHFRRGIALMEKAHGETHAYVAAGINNLAMLLLDTNRLAEAEPLMRRALTINKAGFGNDHPVVATRLSNLAALLQAANRLAEAEPLMHRALVIDEGAFGNDHPTVAIRLNNLALLLKATNRLAEAEPLMRRVVDIFAAALGDNHPNVASASSNLAALLQATNRLAEAEPLMRRALAIEEATFGNDHPNVAIDLNNLATLLQATNRLAEAERLLKDAVRIFKNSLGSGHPRTVRAKGNLQILQDAMRDAENL